MDPDELRLLLRERRHWRGTTHELCEIRPDGSDGGVVATAKESLDVRMQLVFHAAEQRPRPLFASTSDHVWDTLGEHVVTDDQGVVLGSFRKDVKASLGRSTWHLRTADGITAVGRERSRVWAAVRRVSDDPPLRFDFTTDDGDVVLSTSRRWTMRREHELGGAGPARRTPTRLAHGRGGRCRRDARAASLKPRGQPLRTMVVA